MHKQTRRLFSDLMCTELGKRYFTLRILHTENIESIWGRTRESRSRRVPLSLETVGLPGPTLGSRTPPAFRVELALELSSPPPSPLMIGQSRRKGALSLDTLVDVCRLCPVRSTSIKIIDQHIRESHDVELLQRSRELYRVRDKVYLQSWLLEGSRRYWIVLGDASMECPDATRPPQGRISTSSHLDHIYESERARIGDIQASLRQTTTDDNPV